MIMSELIHFSIYDEPAELAGLRQQVRDFVQSQRDAGLVGASPYGWAEPNSDFSKALGGQGWIGMTWPRKYGGHEGSALERFAVTVELERQSVVSGKRVSVRVERGGRR